jgi:hypothetical protein
MLGYKSPPEQANIITTPHTQILHNNSQQTAANFAGLEASINWLRNCQLLLRHAVLFGTNLATFRRNLFANFEGKNPLNPKMESARSLKTSLSFYQARRRHILAEDKFHIFTTLQPAESCLHSIVNSPVEHGLMVSLYLRLIT